MLLLAPMHGLVWTTLLFMACFAALGIGNGALFQLVPLRWPSNTAVASSMIGEVGALGGALLPLLLGVSKQYNGSHGLGFLVYCLFVSLVCVGLDARQKKWVGRWIGPSGKVMKAGGASGIVGKPSAVASRP